MAQAPDKTKEEKSKEKEDEKKESKNDKDSAEPKDNASKFSKFTQINPLYQHYLCGMNPTLSFHIRGLDLELKDDKDTYLKELTKVFDGMQAAMKKALKSDKDISFGIASGGSINPKYFLCDFTEDIVMYLLMDPVWIDCKQRTWMRKTLKQSKLLLNSTYKWDIDKELNHDKQSCKYCTAMYESIKNDAKKLKQFGYDQKIVLPANNQQGGGANFLFARSGRNNPK